MDDGSSGIEANLGTRRMCVAVRGAGPGLLASALRPAGLGRLYLAAAPEGETAVAPAGVDEVRLLHGIVAAVRRRLAAAPRDRGPVFLASDVGIVRIVGDGFGGPGLRRAEALATHEAVRRAAFGTARGPRAGGARLVVVVSDALHADFEAEGLGGAAWHAVPAAAAWLRWAGRRPERDPEAVRDQAQDADWGAERQAEREPNREAAADEVP